MPFEPQKITRTHVLDAVQEIDENSIRLVPSTQWDVIIGGKAYPPIDVLRYAHKQVNGEVLWEIEDEEVTNTYLDRLGFIIRAKNIKANEIRAVIAMYKQEMDRTEYANSKEKWFFVQNYRDKVDPTSPGFKEDFSRIRFANFTYPMAEAVSKDIMANRPDDYRECLIRLFDEQNDLTERIKTFIKEIKTLYREIHPDHNRSAHHDERTIATFLTMKYPAKYTIYMNEYYNWLCHMMGVKPVTTTGEKYVHYMKYIREFASQFIETDEELLTLLEQSVPEDAYHDDNHLLLAQDVIFRTYKEKPYSEGLTTEDLEYVTDGDSMIEAKHPINQILYGPPGTGKTYNSINLAVEIADPKFMSKIDDKLDLRTQIRKRYLELVLEGRISFTTFHQSMCYEDFIEGIKPETRADGTIYYTTKPGIFKRFCDEITRRGTASSNDLDSQTPVAESTISGISDQEFDQLFDKYIENLPNDSETERSSVVLKTKRGNNFDVYRQPQKSTIVVRAGSMRTKSTINKKELKQVYRGTKTPTFGSYEHILINEIFKLRKGESELSINDRFDLSYSKLCSDLDSMKDQLMKAKTPSGTEFGISLNRNGNLTVHTAPQFKPSVTLTRENLYAHATGGKVPTYDKGYFLGVLELLKQKYGYNGEHIASAHPETENTSVSRDNYVLIIDEINRGNVSQIFGELITLIEPDKRAGMPEALVVTLPYSQKKFSVPPNLYIIGTMNTADRSVEALDTALRRRFSFTEMAPEYSLLDGKIVDGLDLGKLLKTINDRIEALIDKDHAIGHSYFLKVMKDECSLKSVFFNEIIPLLQEYFYGNYGKIELVLGSGFVKAETISASIFAKPSVNNTNVIETEKYRLLRSDEIQGDAFVQALNTLLKVSDEA